MSKSKNTARKSSPPESKTATSIGRQSSAIFASSTPIGPNDIEAFLTSLSQQDSPASPSVPPASSSAQPIPATCGPQLLSASAWFDPNTACWRTYQGSLFQDTLEPFSETWPKAGMVQDGVFYPQAKWERPISASGSGLLWPTPNKTEVVETPEHLQQRRKNFKKGLSKFNPGVKLEVAVQMNWPTPTKMDTNEGLQHWLERKEQWLKKGINLQKPLSIAIKMHGGRQTPPTYPTPNKMDSMKPRSDEALARAKEKGGGSNLKDMEEVREHGQLNPEWVEWLMGWPVGWTDLRPLATDRFQRWLRLHGGY